MKHTPKPLCRALAMLAWPLACTVLNAAPIPGLYSTGLDVDGTALGAAKVDPHYKLVLIPDPQGPEFDALAVTNDTFTLNPGFPVGPWIAESATSRWIAPAPTQGVGSDPGDYLYRITFDLTGLDPATARIVGQWTSDNVGTDILLNGASLGITQGGNFGALSPFEISSGFVTGVNTLDFQINNAAPGVNPTGLRVEISRATAEKPGDPPAFLATRGGGLVFVGDSTEFSVDIDGSQPITYQWQLDGKDIQDATESTFVRGSVELAHAGEYTVIAKNAYGTRTNNSVRLRVLEPLPGVFNSGVNDAGAVLEDGESDKHFRITVNPNGEPQDAIVQDSTVFPIVAGPWVLNSDTSKWISPAFDTSAAEVGDYIYRTTFVLPEGFDPATAVIAGRWASDNDGVDILVNGVPTGTRNTAQFGALTPFEISKGIVAGQNTVDFKVNNAGPAVGYTGLRLDPLRVGALRGTGCSLRIAVQPASVVAFAGEAITLIVVADGCGALQYQWFSGDKELAGETASTLALGTATTAKAGRYSVVVRDSKNSPLTSETALVTVLEPIAGLFNTGVGTNGLVLDDASVDPHYSLQTNPHDPSSTEAVVEDSTVFPIVAGPWLANSEESKWIGPVPDTNGGPGTYVYRTEFVVPADVDPATVQVRGGWATDNNGTDILVNGTASGTVNTVQFPSLSAFALTSGFKSGTNTLDFVMENAGAAANPTGLRVEGLKAFGAKGGSTEIPVLQIERTGSSLVLSWPSSATGFHVIASANLGGAWTTATGTSGTANNRNTLTLPAPESTQFYRLSR